MSLVAIRVALETHLSSMTPEVPTAWENTKFDPQVNVAFQKASLLPAEPENPSFGDAFHRAQGIFQVQLNYPLLSGSAVALARAELVKTTFYRGLSLVSSGVTVVVSRTPEIAPALVDGEWYTIPVSIRYFANIN